MDYAADGRVAVVYDLWRFDLRDRFGGEGAGAHRATAPTYRVWVDVVVRRPTGRSAQAFDLFGIAFGRSPDLRPDSARRGLGRDNSSLRKDYSFSAREIIHGNPGSDELDWHLAAELP
jgi:hypothetical protein